MKPEQPKESNNSEKLEGLIIKPEMSEEQIYENLVSLLKKQGIKVVETK